MGRVGTITGVTTSGHNTMLEGGVFTKQVLATVKFDDGAEEAYPLSELRTADG
jgi:hypothetical protein